MEPDKGSKVENSKIKIFLKKITHSICPKRPVKVAYVVGCDRDCHSTGSGDQKWV
jgi:hypothetical protein